MTPEDITYQTALLLAMRQANLSASAYHALLLCSPGPINMTRLSIELGVSTAAATGIADRLFREGLLQQRQTTPNDRRAIYVALTEKADQLLDSITAATLQPQAA